MSGDIWQTICHDACMEYGMSIKWDGDQFVEGERNQKERKEK